MNKAAIAHATNGPFWVTHCSMANEMGSGNCGRLIARANLLRFQATKLRAALRPPLLRRGSACFRKRRSWRLIDGRSRGEGARDEGVNPSHDRPVLPRRNTGATSQCSTMNCHIFAGIYRIHNPLAKPS